MSDFSVNTRIAVWIKGSIIPNYSPSEYRRDHYGFAIRWSDYGNVNSDYGWEIDHIIPDSKDGSDDISNLRPLHWKNNRQRQNNTLALLPAEMSKSSIGFCHFMNLGFLFNGATLVFMGV